MERRDRVLNLHRIRNFILWVLLTACCFETSHSQDANDQLSSTPGLPTVTVRGFLNFKTTVDGTVIVFTPASEVHHHTTEPKPVKTSEINPSSTSESNAFLSKDFKSEVDMHDGVQDLAYASPVQNSLGPIKTQAPNLNMVENKMKEPFLQYISDNAVLPSTGHGNNDLDKIKKIQSSQNQYPTGLVTILGGTFVDGTSTTVFETKVIGTYIDGKYAQILQSTSHIAANPVSDMITTPTLSYSTVERSYSKASEQESSSRVMKITSTLSSSSTTPESSLNVQPKPIESKSVIETFSIDETPAVTSSEIRKSSSSEERKTVVPTLSETTKSPITEEKKKTVVTESKVVESQTENVASVTPIRRQLEPTSLMSSFRTSVTVSFDNEPTETLESAFKFTLTKAHSSFLPVSSTIIRLTDDGGNSLSASQKNRNNTSRTRFLSPRRPSQSVRLNRFKVKLTLRHDSADEYNVTLPADDEDLEEDHTNKAEEEMEVVTEGHIIGLDPAKVVFKETTITSEVTLHVGRRKSIRTLTITTSVPLTVNPTDIPEILAAESTSMDRAASDVDPGHHIVTRTFTTTERALKTSVVPVFDGKSTAYHTVTESFFIMKLITAYRTLPPGDGSVLESIFEEPEVSVTTLEAAANIQPSVIQSAPPEEFITEETIQPSIAMPIAMNNNQQLSNPFLSLGHALSNNPLAAVYLGLQQLNAQMTLYSTVTDTSTYVTTETFYSTKTIRFYDGRSTRYRTVSDPTSTKMKTVTTTITSVQPYLNTQALQQQQQLQKLITGPRLAPMEPQYSTLTSTYTTVTTTTSPSTRIYTLIYNGFSTKFRTVTSFSVFPTTVTVTSTTKVPVVPTQVNVPFAYPYST